MQRSLGVTLLSAFFMFAFLMASLAFVGLLLPGGPLEPLWRLNPTAHAGLSSMGGWGVGLMLVTAVACGIAAFGLWSRARWGRQVAIILIAVNLVSDLLNALVRGDWRTLIGLPIGGAVIWYLSRPRTRAEFEAREASSPP